MFEVNESRAFVASYTPIAEKHGDENKPAGSLKIEVVGENSVLEQFAKGLTKVFFREPGKGESEDAFAKLAAVRFPLLSNIRWEGEYPGYAMHLGSEMGLVEGLKFNDVTLKKLAFEMIEGGSLRITFNAIVHPTNAQAGELCALIQENVILTLTAPTAEEQKASDRAEHQAREKAKEDAANK